MNTYGIDGAASTIETADAAVTDFMFLEPSPEAQEQIAIADAAHQLSTVANQLSHLSQLYNSTTQAHNFGFHSKEFRHDALERLRKMADNVAQHSQTLHKLLKKTKRQKVTPQLADQLLLQNSSYSIGVR